MQQHLKFIAFILVLLIASAKIADFLVGKKGRAKVHEHLVLRPWYFMDGRSMHDFVLKGSESFAKTLGLIVIQLMPVGMFSYAGLAVLAAMPFEEKFTSDNYLPELWNPNYAIIGGTAAITLIFTWAASVTVVQKKSMLLCFLLLLLNFAIASIVLVCFSIYYTNWSPPFSSYSKSIELISGVSLPLGAYLYVPGLFLPSLLHLAFVSWVLFGCMAEYFRRLLVLILERVDESNESPLTFLAALGGGIATGIDAIVKSLF